MRPCVCVCACASVCAWVSVRMHARVCVLIHVYMYMRRLFMRYVSFEDSSFDFSETDCHHCRCCGHPLLHSAADVALNYLVKFTVKLCHLQHAVIVGEAVASSGGQL